MPITQITPMAQIEKHLRQHTEKIEQKALKTLCYVGEQCIAAGRTNGSYTDRTGNLRSSIGYVVVKNGSVYKGGGFEGKGDDGAEQGQSFAKELVSKFPKGLVLIIVAGMDYAAHVSARGFDVLDSAELTAQKLVPQLMKKLGFTA